MDDFLVNTLIPILHAVMTCAVPVILTFASKLVKDKLGYEMTQQQQQWLRDKAIETVHAVESRAERKLIDLGDKWTGNMKHGEAVNRILALAPDLTEQEAKNLVDMACAKLPFIGKAGNQ